MENIIVASSNLFGISPLITSFRHGDYLTGVTLGLAISTSSISHLIECRKHGMPGIGYSRKTSYLWNRVDIVTSVILMVRLNYLIFIHKPKISNIILSLLITSIGLNLASEYDKYNPRLKLRYIILQSSWHITIFTAIKVLLKLIY